MWIDDDDEEEEEGEEKEEEEMQADDCLSHGAKHIWTRADTMSVNAVLMTTLPSDSGPSASFTSTLTT